MKVNTKQYSQALFNLTDGKSEQEVLSVIEKFAEQLKKDGQLKNAGKIMEKFEELYNISKGIVTSKIVGRQQMKPEILEKVREFVKKKYSAKEVEMNFVVDEKIQGGIIIKVGDEIIDASINGRLERLHKILIK